MAGVVYLKTNHFDVKLEGITFKANDFGRLGIEDFLFPEDKVWVRPPIVGIDIMRHPRDPTILLVILCFGLGCVILRFHSGEAIPEPVQRFFTDKRIQFVGFGIPEKADLFPFDELGLVKENTDIGYLAYKILDNPNYIKADLGILAYKILGIKRMFGLTEVSYFERHEQIKSAVCQLFITSVIAMALFSKGENVKAESCSCSSPSKKSSFLKNLSSLPSLTEGWFKLPKASKKEEKYSPERGNKNLRIDTTRSDHTFLDSHCLTSKNKKGSFGHSDLTHVRCKESSDDSSRSNDAWNRVRKAICRKPLKGILKGPSSPNSEAGSSSFDGNSSPSTPKVLSSGQVQYRRANSKGHNVTFKFK
nr:uncharacterized protein LOC109207577 [Ipomoea batatas]GMD23024.1 uncharacterized protein LOC109207577 [Ipomoea batatas]GMD35581.1 uncharacterized protein LOC109207577 [Ipomoea batatas]GMD82911.1 uncharacterized protein LOC109207577 [Ipomoea batatas]GME02016.1 uncharacterized protein LOC109207577 [Ipomoea batatas]